MRTMVAALGTFVLTVFGSLSLSYADFGDPIPGLTDAEKARFADGKDTFSEIEGPLDGLGPVFNEASCATCHVGPATAVGGTTGRLETRFGKNSNGVFDPLAGSGGSLIQDHGIGAVAEFFPNGPAQCQTLTFVPEVVPPAANVTAPRRTTPLFGLGFVDAVPDSTFIALAAAEARLFPGQKGTVSFVTDADSLRTVVGKFGWKAQESTLHAFSGDAYLNEMGITNPSFPDESCPQGDCSLLACNPRPDLNDDGEDVELFHDFMTFLDAPPPPPANSTTIAGGAIFAKVGCANCHTPALVTGSNANPVFNKKAFFPFSDFLLHDMASLGDGITQNQATGGLMRTAPLWGLHASAATGLLHDGSTHSIATAILRHDGQGLSAKRAFQNLSAGDKSTLLAFLNSL